MYAFLIVLSFLASMTASAYLFKAVKKKMISIFLAFLINSLFLGLAFSILYNANDAMRLTSIGDSKIIYLPMAIPYLTWLNALVLFFLKFDKTSG